MKKSASVPQKIEIIFNALYLLITSSLALYLVLFTQSTVQQLWGFMAMLLVFGDFFHLIPRILRALHNSNNYTKALGLGKLITSVTMSIFYVLLWFIGLRIFNVNTVFGTTIMLLSATLRIILCLCPQNKWTSLKPNYRWGIYRNIPFVVQGLAVGVLYYLNKNAYSQTGYMWILILLSYAFYIPVVLFADKNPKIGMLMLAKTCIYVWIIAIGLRF
ncbi:MAG: hypothetical protein R3Y36_08185 [Spirochaetales bacterium]